MQPNSFANKPPPQKFICTIIANIMYFVLAITFACAFAFAFAIAADYLYNTIHAIPDPAARGDDLGLGLIVIAAGLASFGISIPVLIIARKYIFTNTSTLRRCK